MTENNLDRDDITMIDFLKVLKNCLIFALSDFFKLTSMFGPKTFFKSTMNGSGNFLK